MPQTRFRLIWLLSLTALLGACSWFKAAPPPASSGPTATINDALGRVTNTRAELFYLSGIDGREVDNSHLATRKANNGRRMELMTQVLSHPVPARPLTLDIAGRTEYVTYIYALTGKVYAISGKVSFTPEAGRTYTVRGSLGDDYSAVWLEDEAGHLVGQKAEIHGSAEVGILGK